MKHASFQAYYIDRDRCLHNPDVNLDRVNDIISFVIRIFRDFFQI